METEQIDPNDYATVPGDMGKEDFTKYTVNVTTKYMCRYCAQQFDSTDSMQRHLVSHNTGKAPYSCYACGKTYNTPSKLKRHVRVHSGEKPYPCNVCGRKFSRSDHVKQHMKVHLPERLRFFCRICKARFFRTQMLQSHLRMQHGIHNVFSCLTCGEAFQSMTHLINHKKSHPNDQDAISIETDEGMQQVKIKQEPTDEEIPVFGVAKFAVAGNEQAIDDIKIEEPSGMDVADFVKHEVDQGDACTNTEDVDFPDNDDDDLSSNESEPAMSVSACFSLASEAGGDGQMEHSETVTDGNKMFLIPSALDDDDDKEDGKKESDSLKVTDHDKEEPDQNVDKKEELPATSQDNKAVYVLSKQDGIVKQKTQVVLSTPKLPIRSRKSLLPTGPYHQDRFVRVSAVPASVTPSQRAFNMPQTRSLLMPNTHPQPSVSGRKLLRCEHCCIWFEDLSMYMLHSSLHSADESDPFTCKKCLKKLGNRLEFMAHLVWHLEPSM